MIPKEKAVELVDKFRMILILSDTDAGQEILCTSISKECALTAVDEILWEIIKYADNSREYVVNNSKYWQEVKQEIETL